jgi:GNAT superfamily N-acetyltransferase
MMEFHSVYDPRFRFAPAAQRELERHLVETTRSRDARILLAEADGRVIGYVLGEVHKRKPLYPMGCYGFISDISITEAWRRRGVGRTLVENLVEWFRMKGVTAIELFVAEANPISMAFWDSMGFGEFLRLRRRELE